MKLIMTEMEVSTDVVLLCCCRESSTISCIKYQYITLQYITSCITGNISILYVIPLSGDALGLYYNPSGVTIVFVDVWR